MSNILPTFFPLNKNTNSNNKMNKLTENKNILKLPRITVSNPDIQLIESNNSLEELNNPNKIGHYFRISKIKSYNEKVLKKVSNESLRNKIFLEINHSSKSSINKNKKKYILNYSSLNNTNKEKISNNNSINSNSNNDNIFTDRNIQKETKIKEYINTLLNNDKNRINFLNNNREEKFTLDKTIDPVKYIKNMFLDESYNNDIFRTSKIQNECFNGNEELRNDNIKKINVNNMNNLNLKSLKLESQDDKTKLLINEMLQSQKKLNNFYFGKKLYKSKLNKISNHIDIKNYLKYRKKEIQNDENFSLNEKIKSVITEANKMKINFINKHKSRDKILKNIRQFCDNYDGIVRRASILKIPKIIYK